MNTKYKEIEISDIRDNTYLCTIKDIAMSALFIKEHISMGDDEWDDKLNKAINSFRKDLKDLASMEIEVNENYYSGKLSLERLIKEFNDFYLLISCISPLGEEESRFVIAYEFLENKIKEKMQKDSSIKVKKNYYWDYVHQDIKKVSRERYESEHYADAVEAAFKEVIKRVKDLVNSRTNGGFDGDRAMNRAFGFEKQEPLVKFNNVKSDEEKDEQRGIMNLYKGIVGIRNRKAHENVILNDSNRALEYLALASLLMRLLDEYKN